MLYCSAEVGEGAREKDCRGGAWPVLCLNVACTCVFENTREVREG